MSKQSTDADEPVESEEAVGSDDPTPADESVESVEPGETEASGTRARRVSRKALGITAAVVVLVIAVAAVAWSVTREEVVPYDDPRSSGLLTLCDESGRQVTKGSVDDTPFAPIVFGQTPVDERVPDGAVVNATLFGYQPREAVDPQEFSGSPIGGPVPFVDRAKPATRVVKEAWSIGDFVEVFPAKQGGYVQLRLITSTNGIGAISEAYDTADIKVDGDSWHVVRGGDADCSGAADLLGD